MLEIETVEARLNIEVFVDCPNDECGNLIDLLNERDTDGTMHDDDGQLLRQVFPYSENPDDFECKDVVCSECKTTFNVKGLGW